jgi:nicotinate-nucleotide adenylyltransferase
MSRIGIYGGTFDPIHHGHLITAQLVRELRNLDKIIFIPSFISPHKMKLDVSISEHRIKMLKLAIENVPYFDWSDFEIMREKVSYTIDTLLEMKKQYDEIELIVGADNIKTFHRWKSPEEILKLTTLIVLRRRTDADSGHENKYMEKAVFLETPRIDISGTIIRQRVRQSLPIDFLVPQNVMKYIYDLKLYKE